MFQASPDLYLHHFEAYPRTITIPSFKLDSSWWGKRINNVINNFKL